LILPPRAESRNVALGLDSPGFASIPCELNPSPSACFCPQSELCRCSMVSAEDRLANLLEAQSSSCC
jgi:hypothetical protein